MSGFACQECGHKFRTIAGAERAMSQGCPKCNSSDIDLISPAHYEPAKDAERQKRARSAA